jgi:hypothetical protein
VANQAYVELTAAQSNQLLAALMEARTFIAWKAGHHDGWDYLNGYRAWTGGPIPQIAAAQKMLADAMSRSS